MSLSERLAAVRLNQKRFAMSDGEVAGRSAEQAATLALARQLAGTGWRVHAGLRVPDPKRKGRRELDFVITAPDVVLVVELKNWAGEIVLDEGKFLQLRRPPKPPVKHGDIIRDLHHKMSVLGRYHAARDGLEAPMQAFVAFYNRRLVLPEALHGHEEIIFFGSLLEELPSKPDPTAVTPEIASMRESLDSCGSWDMVRLHGGRLGLGDIHTNEALEVAGHTLSDREAILGYDLLVDRSTLSALFKPPRCRLRVRYRDGREAVVDAPPELEVPWRPAGQKKLERSALRHLEEVRYGYVRK